MSKAGYVQAAVEPNIKATLAVLAEQSETNESAVLRMAIRRHIEAQIADLEMRISLDEQRGLINTGLHARLQALRAAYAADSVTT